MTTRQNNKKLQNCKILQDNTTKFYKTKLQKTTRQHYKILQDNTTNGILLYSEEKQQDFFGCLARFLGCPGLREADNPEI